MDNFISELRALIGSPPIGYEWLEYVFMGVLCIFLCSSIVSLLSALFRWIGGGYK